MRDAIAELLVTEAAIDKLGARGITTQDARQLPRNAHVVVRNPHKTSACRRAGLGTIPRPYDLRHSFASLLLADGRQPLYVAEQLGHSPAVLHDTYAHLFAEYADRRQVDPEHEIDRAREHASRPTHDACARRFVRESGSWPAP